MLLALAALERAFLTSAITVATVLTVQGRLISLALYRQMRLVLPRGLRVARVGMHRMVSSIDEGGAGAAEISLIIVVLAALLASYGRRRLAQRVSGGVSVHGGLFSLGGDPT